MRVVARLMNSGPVEQHIREALNSKLQPSFVALENESHRHTSRGEAESHFKLIVVSQAFEGKGTLDRHRLVNAAVMQGGQLPCHALTIKALTPEQFEALDQQVVLATPPCMGGEKKHY